MWKYDLGRFSSCIPRPSEEQYKHTITELSSREKWNRKIANERKNYTSAIWTHFPLSWSFLKWKHRHWMNICNVFGSIRISNIFSSFSFLSQPNCSSSISFSVIFVANFYFIFHSTKHTNVHCIKENNEIMKIVENCFTT